MTTVWEVTELGDSPYEPDTVIAICPTEKDARGIAYKVFCQYEPGPAWDHSRYEWHPMGRMDDQRLWSWDKGCVRQNRGPGMARTSYFVSPRDLSTLKDW